MAEISSSEYVIDDRLSRLRWIPPPRKAPGRAPTVTAAWKAELLRVIDLDPPTVGVQSANWTTGLLARYMHTTTQLTVSAETVRLYLHAHDYVYKRPTWTLKRKAEDQLG